MSASVVSPVFVGRQDEIAALTALLDRVQRTPAQPEAADQARPTAQLEAAAQPEPAAGMLVAQP